MKTLTTIFAETRHLSLTEYHFETQRLMQNTKQYGDYNLKRPLRISKKTGTVSFISCGSASAAMSKVLKYKKVALLNFANPIIPGGGVTSGATAQEENLCRCSNLYESISQVRFDFYDKGVATDDVYTNDLIYSPKTLFFRNDVTYDFVDPVFVDVITCAAPSCLFLDKEEAFEVYIHRIENIVLSAIKHKVTCLVLGAWGCGVFAQDPEVMSKAFVHVLNKYSGYFEEVVFAIRNNIGSNSINSNFEIFSNTFLDDYNGTLFISC